MKHLRSSGDSVRSNKYTENRDDDTRPVFKKKRTKSYSELDFDYYDPPEPLRYSSDENKSFDGPKTGNHHQIDDKGIATVTMNTTDTDTYNSFFKLKEDDSLGLLKFLNVDLTLDSKLLTEILPIIIERVTRGFYPLYYFFRVLSKINSLCLHKKQFRDIVDPSLTDLLKRDNNLYRWITGDDNMFGAFSPYVDTLVQDITLGKEGYKRLRGVPQHAMHILENEFVLNYHLRISFPHRSLPSSSSLLTNSQKIQNHHHSPEDMLEEDKTMRRLLEHLHKYYRHFKSLQFLNYLPTLHLMPDEPTGFFGAVHNLMIPGALDAVEYDTVIHTILPKFSKLIMLGFFSEPDSFGFHVANVQKSNSIQTLRPYIMNSLVNYVNFKNTIRAFLTQLHLLSQPRSSIRPKSHPKFSVLYLPQNYSDFTLDLNDTNEWINLFKDLEVLDASHANLPSPSTHDQLLSQNSASEMAEIYRNAFKELKYLNCYINTPLLFISNDADDNGFVPAHKQAYYWNRWLNLPVLETLIINIHSLYTIKGVGKTRRSGYRYVDIQHINTTSIREIPHNFINKSIKTLILKDIYSSNPHSLNKLIKSNNKIKNNKNNNNKNNTREREDMIFKHYNGIPCFNRPSKSSSYYVNGHLEYGANYTLSLLKDMLPFKHFKVLETLILPDLIIPISSSQKNTITNRLYDDKLYTYTELKQQIQLRPLNKQTYDDDDHDRAQQDDYDDDDDNNDVVKKDIVLKTHKWTPIQAVLDQSPLLKFLKGSFYLYPKNSNMITHTDKYDADGNRVFQLEQIMNPRNILEGIIQDYVSLVSTLNPETSVVIDGCDIDYTIVFTADWITDNAFGNNSLNYPVSLAVPIEYQLAAAEKHLQMLQQLIPQLIRKSVESLIPFLTESEYKISIFEDNLERLGDNQKVRINFILPRSKNDLENLVHYVNYGITPRAKKYDDNVIEYNPCDFTGNDEDGDSKDFEWCEYSIILPRHNFYSQTSSLTIHNPVQQTASLHAQKRFHPSKKEWTWWHLEKPFDLV